MGSGTTRSSSASVASSTRTEASSAYLIIQDDTTSANSIFLCCVPSSIRTSPSRPRRHWRTCMGTTWWWLPVGIALLALVIRLCFKPRSPRDITFSPRVIRIQRLNSLVSFQRLSQRRTRTPWADKSGHQRQSSPVGWSGSILTGTRRPGVTSWP
jgi:hypothetical protein